MKMPCTCQVAPNLGIARALSAFVLLAVAYSWSAEAVAQTAGCPALLDHRMKRLQDDAPQNLCQYAGKVILAVNTASYCGFTNQYEGLEALHAKYAERGLVVLGFPSNDFGQQEPDKNSKIAEFCYNTYGVKFPMFSKTSVRGSQANPFYAALAEESGKEPGWNFHKFLIDRSGKVLGHYPSRVNPKDPGLVAVIEKALAQKK